MPIKVKVTSSNVRIQRYSVYEKGNLTFIELETADFWQCCLEITENMYKMKKKTTKIIIKIVED